MTFLVLWLTIVVSDTRCLAATVPRQIKGEPGKTKCALPATGSNADSVNSVMNSSLFVTHLVNSVAEFVKSVSDVILFVTDSVNCAADLVESIVDLTLSGLTFVLTVTKLIPSNPSKVTGALEEIASRSDKTVAVVALVTSIGEEHAKNALKTDSRFRFVALSVLSRRDAIETFRTQSLLFPIKVQRGVCVRQAVGCVARSINTPSLFSMQESPRRQFGRKEM
jgi:hypothetical protein